MTVIAIGGAEKKTDDMIILRRIMQEASGPAIHLITTATAEPKQTEKRYRAAFAALGVDTIAVSHIDRREAAGAPDFLARLEEANAVFFTGGDQLRLTSVLGGTALMKRLAEREKHGLVIAGTSAGAAAMAQLMVYDGSTARALEKGEVLATSGFKLIRDSVIDTHFTQRGRLPRLFNLLAANPANLGIGLDEDTAAIIKKGRFLEVAGSGTVTIVDASSVRSDIAETERGNVFAASGFIVSVLRAGSRFDLGQRRPVPV